MSNIKDFFPQASGDVLAEIRKDADYLNYKSREIGRYYNLETYAPLGIVRTPKKIIADCFGAIGKVNVLPTTYTNTSTLLVNGDAKVTISFNKPGQIPPPATPVYGLKSAGEGTISPLALGGEYPEGAVNRRYVVTAVDNLGETTVSGQRDVVLNSGQRWGQVSEQTLGIGNAGQAGVSSQFERFYSIGLLDAAGNETRPINARAVTFSNKITDPVFSSTVSAIADGGSSLTVGSWEIKQTFKDPAGSETAASSVTTIDIASGQALKMYPNGNVDIGSFHMSYYYKKARLYFRPTGGVWRYVDVDSFQSITVNENNAGTAGNPPTTNNTDVSTSIYYVLKIDDLIFGLADYSLMQNVTGFRLYKGSSSDITTHRLLIDSPAGFEGSAYAYAPNNKAKTQGDMFYEYDPGYIPSVTSPPLTDGTWNQNPKAVTLEWNSIAHATAYNVYFYNTSLSRYVKINANLITGTTFLDDGSLDYETGVDVPGVNGTDSYDASLDAIFSTLNNEDVILNTGDHISIRNISGQGIPMKMGYSVSIPISNI